MNWFERLCRNTGLMFHNIAHPDGPGPARRRGLVRKSVQEKKIAPTVTLRRTTIEEIEVTKEEGKDEPRADTPAPGPP